MNQSIRSLVVPAALWLCAASCSNSEPTANNQVNPNSQPGLENYTYLIERQLKPEARKDIPALLKELEVQPTSMIDISDGLSSEALHLSKTADVGIQIYEDKIQKFSSFNQTGRGFDMISLVRSTEPMMNFSFF